MGGELSLRVGFMGMFSLRSRGVGWLEVLVMSMLEGLRGLLGVRMGTGYRRTEWVTVE